MCGRIRPRVDCHVAHRLLGIGLAQGSLALLHACAQMTLLICEGFGGEGHIAAQDGWDGATARVLETAILRRQSAG